MSDAYESAFVMLDGKLLATDSAEIDTAPTTARSVEWTQPISGDALDTIGEMFGVMRFAPVQPSGTATFHLGGILRVALPIAVTGADPAREDERGTAVAMHAEADPKAWRRAVSMAVEQAIVDPYRRDDVVIAALALRDPRFNRMAHRLGFSRPGGKYRHGDRKWRKAMRRLLRAAGVTVQATAATCLDGLPPNRLQPHERGLLAPFLKSGKTHEWKAAT